MLTSWLRQILHNQCLLFLGQATGKKCLSYLLHDLGLSSNLESDAHIWPPCFECAFLLHQLNPQQKSDSNAFSPYSYIPQTWPPKQFNSNGAVVGFFSDQNTVPKFAQISCMLISSSHAARPTSVFLVNRTVFNET